MPQPDNHALGIPGGAQSIKLLAITDLRGRPEAETLIHLHAMGAEVRVLAPRRAPYGPLLSAKEVAVERWTRPRPWNIRGLGDLRRTLALFTPDVVLLRGSPANVACLVAVGRTARTLVFVDLFEGDDPPGFIERSVAIGQHVAGFVCDLEAPFQAHLGPERLTVIPPGHDPRWYPLGPGLTHVGVPERAFAVGALGIMPGDEQMRMVIEAARWLPMDLPIHFLLVAHHDDHDTLRRRIRKNPFPQRFHVTDDIGAAPGLMAQCDAFVCLRWNSEPVRRSVLHCLHHGVPPIAEDTAVVRQVINSGVSGMVLPPGDPASLAHAVAELYERRDQRQRLREGAAQEAAARFRMDRVLRETQSLLERTVAGA